MKELIESYEALARHVAPAILPFILILVVIGYFLKLFLEKRIEGLAGRFEEIAKTSLEIKKEIRHEERTELVTFRVALEEWESFLQTVIFDYSMTPPSKAAVETLYKEDKDLFLKVKVAVVKVGIYLRDKELEQQLMAAVIKLRQTYYPIINEPMPRLIDLQSRLLPYEIKRTSFEKSGFSDMNFAPTEKDRELQADLQNQLTKEMQHFSETLLKEYRGIAEQLCALKESINKYIYQPIHHTDIDKK